MTGDLKPFERLKLFILNLGHTHPRGDLGARRLRADAGLSARRWRITLSAQSSIDPFDEEVLPVFAGIGMKEQVEHCAPPSSKGCAIRFPIIAWLKY